MSTRLTRAVCYEGTIKGEFPDRNLPTQMQLRLKIGAQVIFVRNDPEHRWVNGTIAQIADMGESAVTVETEDGERYDVEREMWENVRYSYNEKEHKIEEEQLGTFVQFPLRLAWALTVHKSQGLTFKNVIIQDCSFTQLDSNGYMIYNCVDATGNNGYYLTDGKAIPISWYKNDYSAITKFYDKNGNEITVNDGKTYIALVPSDTWGEVAIQ